MKRTNVFISALMALGIIAMLVITACEEDAGTTSKALTSLTSLEYSVSTINAVVKGQIADITPTVVPDGATAEYSISLPLPAGLALDKSSGVISGTPDAVYASTTHTVTATGSGDYTGTMT
ncbi:MAG: putative Ig domain-containing protein, partial [Candidatus Thiodiazotropha sp.]|nr:putative Ig domain-containing protein [Candidatus Thiodiazotropha sp.]